MEAQMSDVIYVVLTLAAFAGLILAVLGFDRV
jgi:hypothetical protein